MITKESFPNLNFGTKPTTVGLEVIEVTINPDLLISGYADAYSKELYRRNPGRAQQVNLTADNLYSYFKGCLAIRIESLTGNCKVWRQAKSLLIPAWIEFTLSQVGVVIDTDRGLRLQPTFSYDYDINELLETSNKLRSFMADGLVLNRDAFPRSDEGDPDTMSMAIIDGFVQSQSRDAHPITSYIAAFLGFKIKEEAVFKLLYRVRYDDVNFISSMLLREGSIY